MMQYKCRCCGNYTLPEPSNGTDFICPVCDWQDDYVQTHDPNFEGGANDESLNQARDNYKEYGAKSERHIGHSRKPLANELPENNKRQKRYECDCCGNYTYEEPSRTYYYVCPVCYWEHMYLEPEQVNYYGGEGVIPTLEQAKENYKKFGAFAPHAVSYVREPYSEELPEINRSISKDNDL